MPCCLTLTLHTISVVRVEKSMQNIGLNSFAGVICVGMHSNHNRHTQAREREISNYFVFGSMLRYGKDVVALSLCVRMNGWKWQWNAMREYKSFVNFSTQSMIMIFRSIGAKHSLSPDVMFL